MKYYIASMKSDAMLTIRLPQPIRQALELAADADERSLSYVVTKALEAWLKSKGWLDEPKKLAGR